MERDSRIYIAGHRGLVGSALVRRCKALGFNNLVLVPRSELDLRDQRRVKEFFARERPEYVMLAAARVGGIHANNAYPAEFIYDNLIVSTNVVDAAWRNGTKKLLFLGSSCIYPKLAPQPLREEYLFSGPLEPTNEPYAVAKLAGLKMCQAYRRQYGFDAICSLPTNLYGPGDNFDLETSHVLPALIRKISDAAEADAPLVKLWGTGTPRREFLYVDDLADACVHLMQTYSHADPVNIGCGEDLTIAALAQNVADAVGYRGRFEFDPSRPDGTPRKILDISRLVALGWHPKTSLEEGLAATWQWYSRERNVPTATTYGVARLAEA
jgi:GDP-L-fucose synthase